MNNRRDFLKTSALGAAGLMAMSPWQNLYAVNPTSDTKPSQRFIFLRFSSGLWPSVMVPQGMKDEINQAVNLDLNKYELPKWLNSLEKHKKNMTILQGLSARMCTMGHMTRQSPLGVFKSSVQISTIKRATVDFELAKLFPSPFEHVELTCAGNQSGIVRGLSASGPLQPNYAFASPKAAFDSLFALASQDRENKAANDINNEVFDYISRNGAEKIIGIKGKYEQSKLENYVYSVDALRTRNKKLLVMSDIIQKNAPIITPKVLSGNHTTVEQHYAYADILLSAMIAGLTNVVTLTLDDLESKYTGIIDGEEIGLHHIGHGKSIGSLSGNEVREMIRVHQMTVIDKIVTKLKATPEGKGNMFDNTVIMYLPENGEKHHSVGTEVPFLVLAGDNIKMNITGRYIRLPGYEQSGHKTIGNWYTTILNAYGNPIKHYGDLDLQLKIDQEGPIKQFV